MAIPNLKLKLKQNLKKSIEDEKSGGGRIDLRFLNYFDLKFDEKMTVLFVPDVNGEFWTKFSKHGPNLKTTGADGKERAVRVAHENCARISSGEECSVCQKGFDMYALAKETGDKAIRAGAKVWMPRDYTLVSCIVIEAPMDIVADATDNQVKLMYLPYGIENVIKEHIAEGLVSEDELCSTPFVIKKSKNAGGLASYDNSYFARKMIDDEGLAFLDGMNVEQYDYLTLDAVPKNTTAEDMDAWLAIAEEAYEKALNGTAKASQSGDTGQKSAGIAKQESRLERMRKEATEVAETKEPEEQPEAKVDTSTQEPDSDAGEEEESKPVSNVRSRLSGLRR